MNLELRRLPQEVLLELVLAIAELAGGGMKKQRSIRLACVFLWIYRKQIMFHAHSEFY